MPQVNPIAEAIERTVELTCCYEVWRQLVNRDNEAVYRPVVQIYDEFFITVIHSLLQSFAVISYQLFESRKDTVSISSLLRPLKDSHPDLVARIDSRVESQRHLLIKTFAVRNKVYAHRSNTVTPEDVFASVGITPDEMRAVVDLAQRCVASVADALGERSEVDLLDEFAARSSSADKSTVALMMALHAHGR